MIARQLAGMLGRVSMRATTRRMASSARTWLRARVLCRILRSTPTSQGLASNWWATVTDFNVMSRSSWPLRIMRMIWGKRSFTAESSATPSMPGMRISEITTSTGRDASWARAAAPLSA